VSENPTTHSTEPSAAPAPAANKSPVSPTTILTVVIALLLGFMISMNLQKKKKDDQTDLFSAQAELASRTATVNAERARQGLPPLEGIGMDSPEQIAARLTKDAATLANFSDRFRSLLTEKDSIIAEKNNSLLVSEQARQALSSQLAKVQSQLDKTVADGASVESLRAQLAETRSTLDMFSQRPTAEELQAAKLRIADLEAQLAAEKARPPVVQPLPANNIDLFADTHAELLPMAQGLFMGLRGLQDKSDIENNAAYNHFAMEYKARWLKDVRYATGSSEITPADKMDIAQALGTIPKDCMILVVGYASTTGNADANRSLASQRAKTVAEIINASKPGNQMVQAVYIGQTNRFSSRIPERNQVCEVWQINAP
jgi:outer membrane protein OmpA-like peptidoglycan-associated protein